MVYEALLTISAGHKSALGTCLKNTEEATKWKVVGLSAYGKTLSMVARSLQQEYKEEERAVLVVLLLLTYFECFMENPNGALRHLWAAIQLLQKSEGRLSGIDLAEMVPVQDVVLRLDFLAQKLVPYACSSLVRTSDLAFMHAPFWNRSTAEFPGIVRPDPVTTEGHSLVRLVGGHNTISKVVWGGWYPKDDRPHREELMGFYDEMLLWKSTSPATFAAYTNLDEDQPSSMEDFYALPIPPEPLPSSSSEAALNIVMFNGYLGCALAMIASTEEDSTAREMEIFRLAYQNMRICAGLIHGSYKPVEALNMGVSMFLYHGFRRCYSKEWQAWTHTALQALPHEGLSSGLAFANTLEIMDQVHQAQLYHVPSPSIAVQHRSPLGSICERLVPMLMPRGDDGRFTAFYLRYGTSAEDSDERAVRILAKATWEQDGNGMMHSLKLDNYGLAESHTLDSTTMFAPWRQSVEHGWHGFLSPSNLGRVAPVG
ncbi:hypothetical protein D0Z07_1515 [Hyphodiscus hymeniophilus]|uniref:Uncharacterized protein n=1 Tax=Hyphodiscus hymeniophilus TaxID=353542 RepID=A0A9P6VN98_9HELO|nr:hypothetical protein D0Z07_1515 [Hyphodiscus hymeniophilus]